MKLRIPVIGLQHPWSPDEWDALEYFVQVGPRRWQYRAWVMLDDRPGEHSSVLLSATLVDAWLW
jgi:hypothetical protein